MTFIVVHFHDVPVRPPASWVPPGASLPPRFLRRAIMNHPHPIGKGRGRLSLPLDVASNLASQLLGPLVFLLLSRSIGKKRTGPHPLEREGRM